MIIFLTKFCRNFPNFTKISEILQNLTKFDKICQNWHFREKSGKNRTLRLKLRCFSINFGPKISVGKKKCPKFAKFAHFCTFLHFREIFPPIFRKHGCNSGVFFQKIGVFSTKISEKSVFFSEITVLRWLFQNLHDVKTWTFANYFFCADFFGILGLFIALILEKSPSGKFSDTYFFCPYRPLVRQGGSVFTTTFLRKSTVYYST